MMPEHLTPAISLSHAPNDLPNNNTKDTFSLRPRSPHPYHRQHFELHDPLGRFDYGTLRPERREDTDSADLASAHSNSPQDATPSSDSGSEADDEHFLKGLPAPKSKLHKGVRGHDEALSGTATPVPSPGSLDEAAEKPSDAAKKDGARGQDPRVFAERFKRRREVVRRLTELLIVGSLGIIVGCNENVRLLWRQHGRGCGMIVGLVLLYPVRLVLWAYVHRSPSTILPISVPSSFDPAPALYPPVLAVYAASLISVDNDGLLLFNFVLCICSLPSALFPTWSVDTDGNYSQWAASCLPLLLSELTTSTTDDGSPPPPRSSYRPASSPEIAVLLYPLHYHLCRTLHTLTTTSLLPAELQLLSISLINLLYMSTSPQAIILKSLLWVGGLDILVSCSRVILWGITLARVPKWRFKRPVSPSKPAPTIFSNFWSWRRVKHDLFHAPMDSSACSSCEALDEPEESDTMGSTQPTRKHSRQQNASVDGIDDATAPDDGASPDSKAPQLFRFNTTGWKGGRPGRLRRHTLPGTGASLRKSHTHTPSGRQKRTASLSVRAFCSLTQEQAAVRKWTYAAYVYVCIALAIVVPHPVVGIKESMTQNALRNQEPIGWALGYLFGDLPWFRLQVVSCNLERWISLPPRFEDRQVSFHQPGWVQHVRHATVGEANTRLLLSSYYLGVIAVGLLVVFRLSSFYEVDTRRKVFHFMMVAMLAPSIYIDPAFIALALAIILAIFLLLDLLRASQLPPLSKPLASFLAPYVDGRDLRGPVVISHIFLLIGCAIPFWLSLAALPRDGGPSSSSSSSSSSLSLSPWTGWEVPTREVSMVSGVVCVGLGDAAASLIGRRYGHRKWFWGGGKSLEGSMAFATAVGLGLMAAHIWLRVGGWPPTAAASDPLLVTAGKTGACAGMASLTEAVLTGGNDNVVVPVMLWTCVKSLGV